MSKIEHPLRSQKFSVYQHIGGYGGPDRAFVCFFTDYRKYPMYFQGSTYEECLDRAVAFRDREADKHEKHYRTRIESLRKAREKKGKKK